MHWFLYLVLLYLVLAGIIFLAMKKSPSTRVIDKGHR